MKKSARCMIAVLMILPSLGAMNANAAVRPVSQICRFRLSDGLPAWSVDESRHAIRCAFRRFAPSQLNVYVDGEPKPFYIADRESNFIAVAKNPWVASACRFTDPYGSCGLFQHLMRYWQGRVYAYGRRAWFRGTWPRVNPLNARASAIVTARMVAAGGWGPWGG